MKRAPLIVVSTMTEHEGAEFRDRSTSLSFWYTRAIARAGGLPLLAPNFPEQKNLTREMVARADGVMLTGGDDLQPVIAVGAFVVRRAPGHAEGDPGKQQRDGIGQHMAGVGEQGQRARDQPARNFHRHENGGDDQRPEDAPLVAVLMMAMVMRHLERLPNPAGRSQEFWRAAG